MLSTIAWSFAYFTLTCVILGAIVAIGEITLDLLTHHKDLPNGTKEISSGTVGRRTRERSDGDGGTGRIAV